MLENSCGGKWNLAREKEIYMFYDRYEFMFQAFHPCPSLFQKASEEKIVQIQHLTVMPN